MNISGYTSSGYSSDDSDSNFSITGVSLVRSRSPPMRRGSPPMRRTSSPARSRSPPVYRGSPRRRGSPDISSDEESSDNEESTDDEIQSDRSGRDEDSDYNTIQDEDALDDITLQQISQMDTNGLLYNGMTAELYNNLDTKPKNGSVKQCTSCNKVYLNNMISTEYDEETSSTCFHCIFWMNYSEEIRSSVDGTYGMTIFEYITEYSDYHDIALCQNRDDDLDGCFLCDYITYKSITGIIGEEDLEKIYHQRQFGTSLEETSKKLTLDQILSNDDFGIDINI
jgi:hypothetical protein